MPRRTAAERHDDSRPPEGAQQGHETGGELLRALTAFHHPTRRRLAEALGEGPAPVGRLAEQTGLAVGSVSHHLKALYRHGFVEPAPELARDTRESWWRIRPRQLSWAVSDFEEGSVGRRIAAAAEVENFRHEVAAVRQWFTDAPAAPEEWRRAALSADTYVVATLDQLGDLHERMLALVVDWSNECRVDATQHPHAERRPVRAIVRAFPSGTVAR
jgi:DNA-binding transcriptional ArsR family regulator